MISYMELYKPITTYVHCHLTPIWPEVTSIDRPKRVMSKMDGPAKVKGLESKRRVVWFKVNSPVSYLTVHKIMAFFTGEKLQTWENKKRPVHFCPWPKENVCTRITVVKISDELLGEIIFWHFPRIQSICGFAFILFI